MAVRGEIGGQQVELNNAAEEATLQKLLDVMSDGKIGLAGEMKKVASEAKNVTSSSKGVASAFDKLSSTLTKAVSALNGITKIGGAAVGLAGSLVATQPKVTDLAKGIKDVTGDFLGLGTVLETLVTMLNTNYDMFQKLSKTGIAFGLRVERLQSDFAALGVDSGQLLKSLGANVEQFANLGTATRGAEMALEMNKRAMLANGRTLMRFGMDFDEQNDRFMSFFAMNSVALQKRNMSEAQMVNLSGDYAKYLRELSELTGKQSDEIENGLKQANMNKGFERFLAGLDGETRARMLKIVGTAEAGFGEAGKEAAMAAIMGVGPVTDAAQQITALMPGFGKTITSSASAARNFAGTQEDFNKMLMGDFNSLANQNQGFADANAKLAGTLMLMGDPYGTALSNIINGINLFGGSVDDIQGKMGKSGGAVDLFNTLNIALKDVRAAFSELFTKVFSSGEFQTAMENFAKWIREKTPDVIKFLERLTTDLNPFDEKGRENIMNGLKDLLRQIGETLSQAIREGVGGTAGSDMGVGYTGSLASRDLSEKKHDGRAYSEEEINDILQEMKTLHFEKMKDDKNWFKSAFGHVMSAIGTVARPVGDIFGNLEAGFHGDKFSDEELAGMAKILEEHKKNSMSGGTLAMGSLFKNFGQGQAAMLHGEEAVIPKNSPLGGMLNMMQGDMGNMMQGMKDGKMDIGSMINQAQSMGAKYDAYAKDNEAGIKDQTRGLAKSITGLSDEQLDEMEKKSVQSNNSSGSGTSVNNINGGGLGSKMDELIRINKEMLSELQSM